MICLTHKKGTSEVSVIVSREGHNDIMRQLLHRSKTHTLPLKNIFSYLTAAIIAVGVLPQVAGAQSVGQLQGQIDAINQQISQDQREIDRLHKQADTYENRMRIYRAEEDQIKRQINSTQAEIDQTKADIQQKETELARSKKLIQENAKIVYMQGDQSTLEVLFSSENFSDYISRQEYLDAAKNELNEAAAKSVRLKAQLEEREAELAIKSKRLRGQREQLAAKREEQERLAAQTRGEERRYQAVVAERKQERDRLEAEQRRAYEAQLATARAQNQFVGGGATYAGSSSYPWARASTSAVDSWGLYARQCVSYTAWKVASTGRYVPHFNGQGHARQWPATTAAHGIPNGSTPKVGSVAVSYAGPYGHTMYVEEVLEGGARIRISEYNLIPYEYSERIIPAAGLTYIYF